MKTTALKEVHYTSAVFDSVETVEDAMNIILTPEAGMTTQGRWKDETPALMRLMEPYIIKGGRVLDYGCGIGRLSKPLIEEFHCEVVGVDISANMRALAASCVGSQKFAAIPPTMLHLFKRETFDAAIAIWTLQHCLAVREDIAEIARQVGNDGKLFIVNNVTRAVPVDTGQWIDDGINIDKAIQEEGFVPIQRGMLDCSIAPGWMSQGTFWAIYRMA